MKKYLVITGFLVSAVLFFGFTNTGSAVSDKITSVMVTNFPTLQNVLISNTEPINVSVTNQAGIPQPPYNVNVLNQPTTQNVSVANTQPIDVNVANQASYPQPPYDVNVLNASPLSVSVSNLPSLQQVSVANASPIPVSVSNQSACPQPPYDVNVLNFPSAGQETPATKIITLYNNQCFNSSQSGGLYGPLPLVAPAVFDTDGYSKLVIHHSQNAEFRYMLYISLDGVNWWHTQEELTIDTLYEGSVIPRQFDILGPKYKLEVYADSCLTIKAYLMR